MEYAASIGAVAGWKPALLGISLAFSEMTRWVARMTRIGCREYGGKGESMGK